MINRSKIITTTIFIFLGVAVLLSCVLVSRDVTVTSLPENTPPSATMETPTWTPESLPVASPEAIDPSPATQTTPPEASPTPEIIRFAVIGDYGEGNQAEADVANMVKAWDPGFIITLGDNNYPSGAAETIDHKIGQFYHEFIYPYSGAYGEGADRLRFFPTLGNHDWDINRAQAYFDYFTLPGNERYYDFVQGPIHFFALDTDSREPDGVGRSSHQANWLQERLAASTSIWKVVYGHHPPYTSGLRGPVDWMRWPFQEWGATIYLAGHDHFYERLDINGFPMIINGVGGGPIYSIGFPTQGSQVRYNDDYGALFVSADSQGMTFEFINRQGGVIDTFQIFR